jgi:RHS repeat-associated protein
MQPALSTRIQDGFMAAMRLGGEKPHQGVPGENPAPNPVREACKFTVLLGMRGQAELNRAGSCCTGKERDAESGNDYFEARYFGSSMGRFLSPDPLGGDLTNPQSLNRYSYVLNNPLTNTDPTGLYTCTDSKDCSSKKDQALEKTLAGLRNSKNADVARGANAYGAANADNGVSVSFKDLSGSGKGGDTVSTVGTDADGNLRANSAITINSKDSGTNFTADVGHEGSHAADAQDVVKSGLENGDNTIHAGMNITPYQSEVRAYGVTNAILNSANESRNYSCGSGGCPLGRGVNPGDVQGNIDRLLSGNHAYDQGGRPMSSTNQGPSVVNGVTPKATVPSVPH